MRTRERLKAIQKWIETNLCEGREMKAPGKNMNIADIAYQKPQCHIAWEPSRPDKTGMLTRTDPINVCPGIIVMPNQSHAKYVEEKRFDRYNNIHRSQELGRNLSVSILFSVYEPGIRLPGFVEAMQSGSGEDPLKYIAEGTEEGLFTLTDWMDDCIEFLLRDKNIPGSDLFVEDATMTYSLYTDQNYVMDRRPVYYGFINVNFYGYANSGVNPDINDQLK